MAGIDRQIELEGCFNARDLGGLETSAGYTKPGVFYRSDNIDYLTDADWETLAGMGVGTLIDLRDPTEQKRKDWPEQFQRINVPFDGPRESSFWKKWSASGAGLGCPAFYVDQLKTYPELTSTILDTFANSTGAVWFHCAAGRDRTGLLTIVLLRLARATDDEIIADYELSESNLVGMYERDEMDPQAERIQMYLDEHQTSHRKLIGEFFPYVDQFLETVDPKTVGRIREKLFT